MFTGGRSMRGVRVLLAFVMALVGAMTATASATTARSGPAAFVIPEAALVRPFGEIAKVPCNRTFYSGACLGNVTGPQQPLILPTPPVGGLGIPLGGVGAGSFEVNQDGTFGPWNFGGGLNPVWEMRALSQAAFHLREQYGSGQANWRTLAAPGPQEKAPTGRPIPQRSWASVLPAWKQLEPGDGTYAALYPFGWMNYQHAFQADASLRFFSPIVAKEDRRTSLPLAYFDFRIANPTKKSGHYSVMFTMPNAPAHVPNSWGQNDTFDHPVGPPAVRKGFSSRFTNDKKTGVQGVTLSADSPQNTADSAKSEWTIATRPTAGQKVSYTTSFNANGNGSDVYRPFTRSGRLPDAALDRSHSAGAVAVQLTLKPGQSQVVHFALAWDFPQVAFAAEDQNNAKTVWMRRYTNFYGAEEDRHNNYVAGSYPFHQGFHIADDALVGHDDAVAAVERWWKPIADDPAYPKPLRTGALNELYQLVFNNSVWEGGMVSNAVKPTAGKRLGTEIPGEHMYANIDGGAGGSPELELDVDQFGYDAYQLLFPSLERDIDRVRVEQVNKSLDGDPYKNETDTTKYSQWVTWERVNNSGASAEQVGPVKPIGRGYRDTLTKSIYRDYSYYRRTGDEAFLRAAYPAMVRQLKNVQKYDINPGDHLPFDSVTFSSGYDAIPPNGHGMYNSGLYVLALAVMKDTAQRLGRPQAEVDAYQKEFELAKAENEQVHWVPAGGYYRFTDGVSPLNGAIFLDSFYGEHLAERLGLPDVVDTNHMREHLKSTYVKFMGRRDRAGRLLGAANIGYAGTGQGVYPVPQPGDPAVDEVCQTSEICPTLPVWEADSVWTGSNYVVAGTYVQTGRRFHDDELIRMGKQMGAAVATQNWDVDTNGFQFDSPGWWSPIETTNATFIAYKWALGIWDTLESIKPLHIPNPLPVSSAKKR